MSSDTSQINYQALLNTVKGFKESGELLQGVDKLIEGLLVSLKAQWFIGLVSTAMFDSYVNAVRTQLNDVVKTFIEMSDDLDKTVAEYRRRDEENATKFQK